MVVLGIWAVYDLRHNNYGCGEDGNPTVYPDESAAYGFFCALIITYALELLIWPAIIVNKVIRVLRVNRFWNRGRVDASLSDCQGCSDQPLTTEPRERRGAWI